MAEHYPNTLFEIVIDVHFFQAKPNLTAAVIMLHTLLLSMTTKKVVLPKSGIIGLRSCFKTLKVGEEGGMCFL